MVQLLHAAYRSKYMQPIGVRHRDGGLVFSKSTRGAVWRRPLHFTMLVLGRIGVISAVLIVCGQTNIMHRTITGKNI